MFRDMKRGVKTEDSFQKTMEKIIDFVVKHKETSIWIGVAVLAGIIFIVYMTSRTEEVKPEAELIYTQAIGMTGMGRFQDAEGLFTQLTDRFPNTRPGKIAFYYLGVLNYHQRKYPEALDYFKKFLGKMKNDYLLTPSALYGAGCASEGLQEYEEAVKYYEKVAKDKKSPFYFMGVLAWARVTGILGEPEKARQILENLVAQNPPLNVLNDAKFYIGYFNR